MAGLDGEKSLELLHNGLLDATGGDLFEEGGIGTFEGGSFGELGALSCDDEARGTD